MGLFVQYCPPFSACQRRLTAPSTAATTAPPPQRVAAWDTVQAQIDSSGAAGVFGGTADRQPTEPRADRTTAQLIFNGRPEPFEMTLAAGALDVAVGSPRHYILRGLHIAQASRRAHTRRGDGHRRMNLKEETMPDQILTSHAGSL